MKKLFTLGLLMLASLVGKAQNPIALDLYLQDTTGAPVPGMYAIVTDSTANGTASYGYVSDSLGRINTTLLPTAVSGIITIEVFDFCLNYQLSYQYFSGFFSIVDTFDIMCPTWGPPAPNCNFTVGALPVQTGGANGAFFFSTYIWGGPGSVYTWDFGDGNTDTGQSVTHYYASPGIYNYCLTVDSCHVCDVVAVGNVGGNLVAEGYVLGNGGPNNPWAFVDLYVQVDNSFHILTTDANGYYYASLPNLSNSGVMQASIETCTPAGVSFFEYGNLYTYNVATGNTTLYDTLNISCYGSGSNNSGRILVSGYLLGNGSANGPWANADVLILADTTVYTLTTDANGYYQDSLPVVNPVGLVIASVTDCNGNIIFGNIDTYDLIFGIVSVHDTISASCLSSGGGNGFCQAEFIVDTINSFNGQVVLWNVSLANPLGQTTWLWDFGDGSFSNSPFPTHQYTQPGMYAVCLTVSTIDPNGTACTSTYCDSLGVDANGNLIYKGQNTGFSLVVLDPATIGQDENVLSELKVYPNPARNEVRFGGLTQAADYRLMDTYGRLLQTGTVEAGEKLNLPNLSQGVYLLDVLSEGKRAQVRLLID